VFPTKNSLILMALNSFYEINQKLQLFTRDYQKLAKLFTNYVAIYVFQIIQIGCQKFTLQLIANAFALLLMTAINTNLLHCQFSNARLSLSGVFCLLKILCY
jgi:hypothetical protein